MCAGCCRYITDHKIEKIPVIGGILLKYGYAEKGNWLSKFLAWIYRKEIKRCVDGFGE